MMYTLNLYSATVLYVNYISIKLERKKLAKNEATRESPNSVCPVFL